MIYSVLCKIYGKCVHIPMSGCEKTHFQIQEEDGLVILKSIEPFGKERYRINCEKEYMAFLLRNEKTLCEYGAEKVVLEYEMHYSLQCNGEIFYKDLFQQITQISLPIEIRIKTKEYTNGKAYDIWDRQLEEKIERL